MICTVHVTIIKGEIFDRLVSISVARSAKLSVDRKKGKEPVIGVELIDLDRSVCKAPSTNISYFTSSMHGSLLRRMHHPIIQYPLVFIDDLERGHSCKLRLKF